MKIGEARAQAARLSNLDDGANSAAASDHFRSAVTLDETAFTILVDSGVRAQLEPHPTVEGVSLVKDDVGFTRTVTMGRDVLADLSPDVRRFSLVIRCSPWSSSGRAKRQRTGQRP